MAAARARREREAATTLVKCMISGMFCSGSEKRESLSWKCLFVVMGDVLEVGFESDGGGAPQSL